MPIFFLTAPTEAATNATGKEPSKLKNRSEIPKQDQWNVAAMYPSFKEWENQLEAVQGQKEGTRWPNLASYKGRLADPSQVADMLNYLLNLDRELSKLYVYAHLRLDEDVGNDSNKHYFGLISQLMHDFSLESSWIEPELLTLGDAQYQKLLGASSLREFQFYLEKLSRKRAHTLPLEQERLLALSGKALGTARKAFGALNNADITFKPAVDSKGKAHPLSHGSYLSCIKSPDRELRKTAFTHIHEEYKAHANTICELLQGLVETHVFNAKARDFLSCLDAALFYHNIDTKVYSQLIETVRKNLPLMHEYLNLRKETLNLDQLHPYDLYVPLVPEANMNIPYTKASETVIESVSLLGPEYQNILRKGLTEDRWVDIYENTRKRSGAYSSGCYDSMPYILMNYHGTLHDVLTLAHEAGHSMHSYYSKAHQPYIDSDYPIFVAEVASTFNEQLLFRHLLSQTKTKDEKAILLNYQIEEIRGTVIRQTLFAEFELQIHKWLEDGIPLTPTLLKETYLKLNKEYYGPDFIADDLLGYEWARIPHFYSNFYVYQYATGISAALELFKKVSQSDKARDKYLQFLSSGGSRYPLDLLKIAGVDMTSPEPVQSAMEHFGQLVAELRECLSQ